MKQTYADVCLERAQGVKAHKLRVTAVVPKEGIGTAMPFYLGAVKDFPELARRLKRAIWELKLASRVVSGAGLPVSAQRMEEIANELEEMPEGDK